MNNYCQICGQQHDSSACPRNFSLPKVVCDEPPFITESDKDEEIASLRAKLEEAKFAPTLSQAKAWQECWQEVYDLCQELGMNRLVTGTAINRVTGFIRDLRAQLAKAERERDEAEGALESLVAHIPCGECPLEDSDTGLCPGAEGIATDETCAKALQQWAYSQADKEAGK